MTDFGKVNPQKAQEIIKALKDGKINAKEAKQLGLTAREAAELNQAFSAGEARVGDFVLVNKGKSKDGKVQYSQTKQIKPKTAKAKEEAGLFDKAVQFAKENAGALAAGTAVVAGAICCATGLGASVGVPLILAGGAIGLTSCTTMEQDMNMDLSFINDNSSLLEAINALKEGQEVQIEILQKILAREVQNGATLEEILNMVGGNQNILNKIASSLPELFRDVITQMNAGNEEILKAISNLQASVDVMTDFIAMLPGDIKNEFEGDLQNIINALKTGNASLEELNKMVKGLADKLGDITDRLDINNEYQKDIKEILEQIRTGQLNDSEVILAMIEILKNIEGITGEINNKLDVVIDGLRALFMQNMNIKKYLDKITEFIKENNNKTDVTNNLLQQLLDKAQGGGLTEAQLEAILKAISENSDKIDTTNSLLEKLLAKEDSGNLSEEQLNAILEAISKNGDKIDITNKLLSDIKGGQEYILDAINKFGVDILNKMDVVVKLINNIGNDNKEVKAALENILKQLVKMDAHQQADAKKILDAIANIKIGEGGNGNVDLSSVEAMLAKLIELVGQNGKQLSDINAKLDVINITIEAAKDEILKHLKEGNATTKNILNALNEFKKLADQNDQKILAKMDAIMNLLNNIKPEKYDDTKLMNKLDDILNAIKDHDVNVTVDVTGKVSCECNCNCGGNHEGILGDLEDILG